MLRRLLDLGKPVVWTLHDTWPFTGGCHHSVDCEKFHSDCGGCPQLRNDSASRTALKARFLEYLHAAGAAALVGEGFIARHRAANVPGGSPHVRAVERALDVAGRDYERWENAAAQFPTYDRDNWEDDLLAFEHKDMLDGGSDAWNAVRAAATSGPVGHAVQITARSDRACTGVLQ